MHFIQHATLIGVVGKKGTGTLDNGQAWSTDRVELHLLAPFSELDSMAHGQTVTVYQVEDYAKHYQHAVSLIDQEIELNMIMIPSKKLGSPAKLVCQSFSSRNAAVKSTPPAKSTSQENNVSPLPAGVTTSKAV